ncbi:hypothetical protein [Candidatus Tisiphia endosymbiont of Parasteatoda lunata]|uniref:hypothetical protein n=1 Tax=Candidatus Tisiphia endosymbiont of Parasteatoda lunata TaxID=3066275 RepID=UPI00313CB598
MLQFTGNAPITVNRYVKKTLRCNACDYIVMNNKNINKWTNSSRSAIVLQKTYGTPFYRLSRLQSLSGVPVAYSSLWQQYWFCRIYKSYYIKIVKTKVLDIMMPLT